MRAERRAGELLIEMKERGERREHSQRSHGETSEALPPKLSDLGINKTQSSRWQKLAALPEEKFEQNVKRASADAYDRMTGRFLKEAEIERAKQHHANVIEHGCTVADLAAISGAVSGTVSVPSRPDITFESGRKLSVNVTTNETLVVAYGYDSDAWIGDVIELFISDGEYNGKPIKLIKVRPISKAGALRRSQAVRAAGATEAGAAAGVVVGGARCRWRGDGRRNSILT